MSFFYFSTLKDFSWFLKPKLNDASLAPRYTLPFSFHAYYYENVRHESGHSKKGGKFLLFSAEDQLGRIGPGNVLDFGLLDGPK